MLIYNFSRITVGIEMAIPFPNINPYKVLGVDVNANPIDIKKAYKKLSLKYHPDKLQQTKQKDESMFPQIQFAYSILSDPHKRSRYDRTGSLDDIDTEDGEFDWKAYFDSLNENITIEMIEEDKLKYQKSDEEKNDIFQNFIYYEGDFLKLFEVIPHLEFNEGEEERVFNIIQQMIEESPQEFNKSILKAFDKYKKSRKTKVKHKLKKLAKEAKEAQELEKIIKQKYNNDSLESIIKHRQAGRLNDLIGNLEAKYANKKGNKRHISEDEFAAIQRGFKKNKS